MTARLFLAAVAVLALTACETGPTTQPSPPPPASAPTPAKPPDVYRKCVGSTRSKQDACQMKAWGYTFSDDDNNWECKHMGDWLCGPAERKA